MNTYEYSIKVTYQHGGTRTMQGSVSTDGGIRKAIDMIEDDEGYGWPEKRATRETLYVIKVAA